MKLISFAVVVAIMCMALCSRAVADEVLAEELAGAIRSAPSIAPSARAALSECAAEAARTLAPLPPDVTARLSSDLKAVISARRWPFDSSGRDLTPEGVEWLQHGVKFAVARLQTLNHPSASELSTIRAWPGHAARAAAAFTRQTLRAHDAEFQEEVIRRVRDALQAQTPLFGNAFIPELLKPCTAPGSDDSSNIERFVREALAADGLLTVMRQQQEQINAQQADVDAERVADPALTPEQLEVAMTRVVEARAQRRDSAINAETSGQVGAITRALQSLSAPCLHAAGVRLSAPQWHIDMGIALKEREMEQRQAEAEAAMRAFEAQLDSEKSDEAAMLGDVRRGKSGRFTMDEALARAFDGTGMVIIHSTAIPPPSWSRSMRLSTRWRAQFPGTRSSGGGE